MKINKQSSIYFVSFFTIVIFSFILVLYAINIAMSDKIENAKNAELKQLLKTQLTCKNYISQSIDEKNFYYCPKSNIISLHSYSDVAYAGPIEYLASFDLNNLHIKQIDIINHKETPGLGNKIEDKTWLSSLYNKASNLLKLKQNGGAIDSFTAASITPTQFLKSLNKQLEWLKNNKQNIITTINKE
ncbi:MAG: Electron transport complex subunit RsxG [Proteobacteria bacterium]|nr:MAG: Electron transport complex subunit RsxG [Pseudomonadota bacterium]|tara:strand:+ start:2083 stop:2643 length:561 start_codon:yes stop_codon:yes gene_type:complete